MNFSFLNEHGFSLNEKNEIMDFNETINYGFNPLMFCLLLNNTLNINLDKNKLTYLIKKTNLMHCDDGGENFLHYIARNNKTQNLNFTNEEIVQLVRDNSFLLEKRDYQGLNNLMCFIENNKKEDLNLTDDELIEIIKINPNQILLNRVYDQQVILTVLEYKKELSFNFVNHIYENSNITDGVQNNIKTRTILRKNYNEFLKEREEYLIILEKSKLEKEISLKENTKNNNKNKLNKEIKNTKKI